MAAFDTPWMTSMAGSPRSSTDAKRESVADGHGPTTTAAFSPHNNASSLQQRSTILLHQKSPLLLATPPQVTRALAYSHGFIIPMNKMAGLLSWTTGDPWESFLLVATFWFAILYGELVLMYAGPLILVAFLVMGMYFRRYSPLSSTGWTGEKKKIKAGNQTSEVEHRKSLDEILATMQAFTGRCNILLAPMIQMTDFLSTQQTATSATTRPALTTLFVRILFATPFWFALTLPPFRIITGRRVLLFAGTLMLTWHSRPARISRTILWRSRSVRYAAALLTGLNFESPSQTRTSLPPSNMAALRDLKAGHQSIRFTFSLYENQRRWIGLGWTSNMVAYERAPWTDEHLNATPPVDKFQLPEIEGGHAKWRWAEGSSWQVEIPDPPKNSKNAASISASKREEDAWTYFDNKWLNGVRGQDGWSRYTRRRKWTRDAELVDAGTETPIGSASESASVTGEGAKTKSATAVDPEATPTLPPRPSELAKAKRQSFTNDDARSDTSSRNRRSWIGRARGDTESSYTATERGGRRTPVLSSSYESTGRWSSHSRGGSSTISERERLRDEGQDILVRKEELERREAEWGIADDVSMELG